MIIIKLNIFYFNIIYIKIYNNYLNLHTKIKKNNKLLIIFILYQKQKSL